MCVSDQRVSRGPLLRCHGVQECILLVTQRISKYPVLIQRILDNTTGESPQLQWLYYQSTSLYMEPYNCKIKKNEFAHPENNYRATFIHKSKQET